MAAQPTAGVRLNWVRALGTETCVSETELAHGLSGLGLGFVLTSTQEMPVVSGWVEPRLGGVGFVARLRLVDAAGVEVGQRQVRTEVGDCAQLTSAITLVAAMMGEQASQVAVASEVSPDPEPPAAQVPTVQSLKPDLRELDDEVPPPVVSGRHVRPEIKVNSDAPSFQLQTSLGLALASGLQPGLTYGPELGLSLLSPWPLRLVAAANYWASTEVALASAEPGRVQDVVTFKSAQAEISLCVPWIPRVTGPLEILGCWGGAVGVRFASSPGLSNANDQARAYGGLLAKVRLNYLFGSHLGIRGSLGALAMGRDDSFAYRDLEGVQRDAFVPSLFVITSSLAVTARF